LSENKRTVDRYMAGFRVSDHAEILSCLTDDVEWEIPGMFHSLGKAAFDKEIENEAFVGPSRYCRESTDRGRRRCRAPKARCVHRKRDGGALSLRFCDVFEMQAGKIKRLTSYLMEIK